MRKDKKKDPPKPSGRTREEINANPGRFTRAELIARLKQAERAERERQRREGK